MKRKRNVRDGGSVGSVRMENASVHVDVVMILCAREAVRESLNAWQECAQFLGSYVNILCTSDRCWNKMHSQQNLYVQYYL